MSTQTQPTTTQPRKIIIRPYPFNSTIAHNLVTALDAELEAMYPDWESLPHPGFAKFVGGDQEPPEPWSNPVPVLDALDDANNEDTKTNTTISIPSKDNLTPTDLSTLHFHIAFDVTDLPDPSTPSSPGKPIACIGLKAMPYFPSHRRLPSQPPHPSSTPYPSPRHAEIKRLYISPSHRGASTKVTTPTHPHLPTTLSQAMIATVKDFAKTKLGVEKLVLETGCRQVAAIKLYERMGWTRIPDYGDYIGAGVKDGGVSVCYVLDL